MKDAIGIVGLLMIGAGCWMYSPGMALIVVGAILLTLSICSILRDKNADESTEG